MTMWKLKNCPRCQGDLFMDKNLDGWYQRCLQCGYQREMKPIAGVNRDQPTVAGGGTTANVRGRNPEQAPASRGQ